LAKTIALRSESSDQDTENLAYFLPNFLWLLRDFSLELEDE